MTTEPRVAARSSATTCGRCRGRRRARRDAAARRVLSAEELAPLTQLSNLRSLAGAWRRRSGVIALAVAFGLWALAEPLAAAVACW